jgi:excisionase family DNA binding protein
MTGGDIGAVHPNSRAPRYLTVEQLAARWQTTDRTIRRKLASHELPTVRIGEAMVRIALEDIEAFERLRRSA